MSKTSAELVNIQALSPDMLARSVARSTAETCLAPLAATTKAAGAKGAALEFPAVAITGKQEHTNIITNTRHLICLLI
jgi:hypothetical protein